MLSYTRRQEENKSFLLKQFIPARGRKPLHPAQHHLRGVKQFIPARGRKRLLDVMDPVVALKQFIPARGRKRL